MNSISEKIILGTVQFGLDYGINNPKGKISESEAFSILDEAKDAGIQFLDTAEVYGSAQEVIGNYHKTHPHFQVISKFHTGEKSDTLLLNLTQSLKTLNVSSLHAYYFHSFEDYSAHPELIKTLNELKRDKIISHTGVSVYTNEELKIVSENENIDMIQIPYNCLDNYKQRGVQIERAKKAGKEIHARSIFLQGLFFKNTDSFPEKIRPLKKYISQLKEISKNSGISMMDMAMAYIYMQTTSMLHHLIDYLVIGVDSAEQLRQNLSLKTDLPWEVWSEISNIEVQETALLHPGNWK